MLDSYLMVQGALNALNIVTGFLILIGFLFLLGFLGLIFFSGGFFRTVSKGIIYASFTALILLVATVFIPVAKSEHAWVVDFTKDSSFAQFKRQKCAEWKIGEKVFEDCIYEGIIGVDFSFSKDRKFFAKNGRALWASGINARSISISFFDEAKSDVEIEALVKTVFPEWGLSTDDFFKFWNSEERETFSGSRYFYLSDENTDYPKLEFTLTALPQPSKGKRWGVHYKWRLEKL